jgi:hypothetical protein
MGQSVFQANLCAGKIGIDSSIQAQGAGEVMSQNWRIYCLFDSTLLLPGRGTGTTARTRPASRATGNSSCSRTQEQLDQLATDHERTLTPPEEQTPTESAPSGAYKLFAEL